MRVIQVKSPGEVEEIKRLFREYETLLGVDLSFQSFEDELAALPGKYAPPSGALLIAVDGERTAGCVALRKKEEGVCEMKRLFVRPQFRGRGLGRRLAARIIDEALGRGYSTMLLDTLDRLRVAMKLYQSLGFVETEPYYCNPLRGVVYWKLDLRGRPKKTPDPDPLLFP
jgi:GNAT superfamily N-acetyltransferase